MIPESENTVLAALTIVNAAAIIATLATAWING
jgi:hypothetical protein